MVDVHETPAVPPFDPRGDPRAGYFAAGGLLIALGWGLGVGANVLLHLAARGGSISLHFARVGGTMGPYAGAALALGLFTGAFGVALLAIGRATPRGPVVLPGFAY